MIEGLLYALALGLFCIVIPGIFVIGGWCGLIAGARADTNTTKARLAEMERNATGDDKWAARNAAEVE